MSSATATGPRVRTGNSPVGSVPPPFLSSASSGKSSESRNVEVEEAKTKQRRAGSGGPTGAASPQAAVQVLSIAQWWFFNVATVILNKYIFQELKFSFPLTLSTVHFIISAIGAYLFLRVLKLRPLIEVKPGDQWTRVLPMAVVFCINIVLGNVSLSSIPVSFMQTIKSFTPATTVILQRLVWGRHFDVRVYLSLLPVVGGIVLTSVTELSFVWKGFIAAMLGCFVTSTKTILAESLLHGKYNFDSLNTVYHMAPYATMVLVLPALILEGSAVLQWAALLSSSALLYSTSILLFSGIIAFSLNYSIFYVIQTTSALTFNVAGNMKTAVAISASWFLFRNPMSWLNVLGCTITIAGCTLYGYVRQILGARAATDHVKEESAPLLPTTK